MPEKDSRKSSFVVEENEENEESAESAEERIFIKIKDVATSITTYRKDTGQLLRDIETFASTPDLLNMFNRKVLEELKLLVQSKIAALLREKKSNSDEEFMKVVHSIFLARNGKKMSDSDFSMLSIQFGLGDFNLGFAQGYTQEFVVNKSFLTFLLFLQKEFTLLDT